MPPQPPTEVHDSSDWLSTPLSPLAPLDAALRCQICKDFFDTPVITSCSHTFCSLCIRRCLSSEGRCPACRTNDQELKLRRNWAVDELVATFVRGRTGLLTFARETLKRREELDNDEEPPSKKRRLRKTGSSEPRENGITTLSRRTRSQGRRSAQPIPEDDDEDFVVADSEEDEELEQTPRRKQSAPPPPSDGLVECPGCRKRMKEEEVYTHLDRCEGLRDTSQTESRESSKTPFSLAYTAPQPQHPTQQQPPPRDRLPTLSYSLLKEPTLRKKLRDLGLSDTGPRALLQRRHTEWLNLWNASCDSRNPKPKRELLAELDTWERTQGGKAMGAERGFGGGGGNKDGGAGGEVMSKDFDAEGWKRGHEGDFRRLIEMARRKKVANSEEGGSAENTTVEGGSSASTGIGARPPEEEGIIDMTDESDGEGIAAPDKENSKIPAMDCSASQSFSVEDVAA
ncbi:MAG: hypothetical protein Q9160_003385 [Pyrenula sp. 1 TL-2023]